MTMNHPMVGALAPDTAKRNAAALAQAVVLMLRTELPVSPYEGYAQILERHHDLKAEVFHGSRVRARQDAVRLAAAAMNLLCTLGEHLDIVEVRQAVITELERAQCRFGPYASPHEGWAVIEEECDELWVEIRKGDRVAMWDEAVQVAAVALRFHVDIPEEVLG